MNLAGRDFCGFAGSRRYSAQTAILIAGGIPVSRGAIRAPMMEMNQGYPAVAALKMAQIQKRQAERHNYADLALSAIKLERRAIERSKRPLYDTTSWGRSSYSCLPNQRALRRLQRGRETMIDMDKVMSAMNAGDASKISPAYARAMKKKALAEAKAAKKIAAAKKPTAKVVPMKKPEAKKAAASKKVVKKVSKAPVKKAAANKKAARKTMKPKKKSR
jgi:hypothetical protein